jgi:hypothetical protein
LSPALPNLVEDRGIVECECMKMCVCVCARGISGHKVVLYRVLIRVVCFRLFFRCVICFRLVFNCIVCFRLVSNCIVCFRLVFRCII